jgi:hypothetical protein
MVNEATFSLYWLIGAKTSLVLFIYLYNKYYQRLSSPSGHFWVREFFIFLYLHRHPALLQCSFYINKVPSKFGFQVVVMTTPPPSSSTAVANGLELYFTLLPFYAKICCEAKFTFTLCLVILCNHWKWRNLLSILYFPYFFFR